MIAVTVWVAGYVGLWIVLGGFLGSAVALGLTGIVGLIYWRRSAPPGRRGALVGVILFAVLYGLGGILNPDEPAPWWWRFLAPALFMGGLCLVAVESQIVAASRRDARESGTDVAT